MSWRKLHEDRSRREGLWLWALSCVPLLLLAVLFPRLAAVCAVAAGLLLLLFLRFFRDFEPVPVNAPDAIVSPAHGLVDSLELLERSPWMEAPCWRISIYLSLRDVHVQNAPVTGTLRELRFLPGAQRRAIHADAGERNEALLLRFATENSREIVVKLIAGVFVRRIVPWVAPGETVARGQRISLIRFGSRADVLLPRAATVLVKVGDRVVGSETVLARW